MLKPLVILVLLLVGGFSYLGIVILGVSKVASVIYDRLTSMRVLPILVNIAVGISVIIAICLGLITFFVGIYEIYLVYKRPTNEYKQKYQKIMELKEVIKAALLMIGYVLIFFVIAAVINALIF